MTEQQLNAPASVPARVAKAPLSEEGRLIALAQKRDSDAWATLFDRYYPLLFRYARVRLGSAEEAEDAASQVFLHALKAIGRYEDRGQPFLAWLYTIARNIVNKRWQQLSKQQVGTSGVFRTAASEPQNIEHLDLMRGLSGLKDEQRDVVILRFSLGLSLREAALLLNKSEAAIHSLQTRGLQNLRRALRD